MPSSHHQGLVWIFRDRPRLAFDLLESVFGLELPPLTAFAERRGELDRFAPSLGDTGELRPDLALSAEVDPYAPRADEVARHQATPEGAALLVEVQGRVDPQKRFRIWVYWALLAERLERATTVLIVPLNDAVARWARGLGELERPPREALLVLDRQNMPRVVSDTLARERPYFAMLSAMIHGAHGDREVFVVGMRAALAFADERRWRYASSLVSVLPETERAQIQGEMTMQERYELTEAELRSGAYHNGIAKGKLEGKLEGELEGKREVLRTIFELRGLTIDDSLNNQIRACTDPEHLDRWIARAKAAPDAAAALASLCELRPE
ncbi:hypothetical protein PPSIR1_30574 [Plesiocystis pacifica SIR-1]|uniref:DUF4351 domain-containing protein n=1 Tax=Plesiocystis pacifica SIR-1 TaxID=391625 RepID=A6GGR3_9BACT|nr:hypothetical protein [Plesiocystis pacifica]EDM74963.1 hypothetical protein PPSIR1_30574 [Plesiocystis pacifica SIR-1]